MWKYYIICIIKTQTLFFYCALWWNGDIIEKTSTSSTNNDANLFPKMGCLEFGLDEFVPEIYDCEPYGSCSSEHIHLPNKVWCNFDMLSSRQTSHLPASVERRKILCDPGNFFYKQP